MKFKCVILRTKIKMKSEESKKAQEIEVFMHNVVVESEILCICSLFAWNNLQKKTQLENIINFMLLLFSTFFAVAEMQKFGIQTN